MIKKYGPTLRISKQLHAEKYRQEGESFYDSMCRIVGALCDTEGHRKHLKDIFLNQRFMAGGRVQSCIGSPRLGTALNCYVSGVIHDSMDGIMDAAKNAAQTMRMGGGIGYDFSVIRPRGERIKKLGAPASGPISFMGIFDALCKAISSAGNRRGAQMGVLRIDHPDIREFILAKQDGTSLTAFNISIGVTDEFMDCVEHNKPFDLKWDGKVYETISARGLWDEIMRSTYDWAEPGVLFLDRINDMNNLYYCETIAATNPCAEQPLPPNGACLLGSFNLTKYIALDDDMVHFNWEQFTDDIGPVVRGMDNVIEQAHFPLEEQKQEAINKRRMGLGITGLANTGEALGFTYGSAKFLEFTAKVLITLRDEAYKESAKLAKEKGPFPAFTEHYLEGKFIKALPKDIQDLIKINGIRNSHLLSIAPTGTISLCADNISGGIEPVFAYEMDRTIQTVDGPKIETIQDFGVKNFDVKGKRSSEVNVDEHLAVALTAQQYVDSSISKTCNVGDNVSWHEFKDIYMKAWKGGAKGITTFRAAGKRFGILNSKDNDDEPEACYIDENGNKTCDS